MNYIKFHSTFSHLGCFDVNQVRVVEASFDTTALARWEDKGYIVKLRNGVYAFADWASGVDTMFIAGNIIYRPSYVSLYSALSHYGMIPEFVPQITSITTLKTATFTNAMGTFAYRHVKNELFFGYYPAKTNRERQMLIATPEKALLDLLYLTPGLRTVDDALNLRLDDYYMSEAFDIEAADGLLQRFASKSLNKRFSLLLKAYNL
ncbi:MAG: type IV toxin-antitoxin system AbiEi family antitoxin domain-containing protein [Muribaculaceae bacterium]|nr:type IV toxin-antitoxin system AbiEi family antitoxin domain-containing protein [Muribaculaceae bacterium]